MPNTKLARKKNEYLVFLESVKSEYAKTRAQSVRAVNTYLIDFYWWLGQQIAEKQAQYGWGEGVVEQLSHDLKKHYPGRNGLSIQNLWRMRRFYLEYRGLEFLSQAVREIPWSHNLVIMTKVRCLKAREYYLTHARDMGWSRNTLILQIANQSYEHHALLSKQHNFHTDLPEDAAIRADQTMKDIYTLELLNLSHPVVESELESRMVSKIKEVMLMLGYGFTFIGNQYRIRQNNKDYFIDLLFYNRKLQSLVAMELKTGTFKPEYAGKMNFYLNLLDDYVREPTENPSIGIILCSDRDKFEVEYTLRDINKPVGVSAFRLTKTLPTELKDKLPNLEELALEIRRELGEESQS